jgi:hypothetical protein
MLCKIPKGAQVSFTPQWESENACMSFAYCTWQWTLGMSIKPFYATCYCREFSRHDFRKVSLLIHIIRQEALKKNIDSWKHCTREQPTKTTAACITPYALFVCLFIFTFHRSKLGYKNLKNIDIVKGSHSYRSCFIIWVVSIFIAGRGDEDL